MYLLDTSHVPRSVRTLGGDKYDWGTPPHLRDKLFKALHTHSVFFDYLFLPSLEAGVGTGTQVLGLLLPTFLPDSVPSGRGIQAQCLTQSRVNPKKRLTRGLWEQGIRHSVGAGMSRGRRCLAGITYHRAGCETLSRHCPSLPNVNGESAENPLSGSEPSGNPSRDRKPLSSPQAPPSQPPAPSWSQFQILKSRLCTHPIWEVLHDQSRHGARSHCCDSSTKGLRLPPPNFTLRLWAPPSSAGRNHVTCSRRSPPRKWAWPKRATQGSYTLQGVGLSACILRRHGLFGGAWRDQRSGQAARGRWSLTLAGDCPSAEQRFTSA